MQVKPGAQQVGLVYPVPKHWFHSDTKVKQVGDAELEDDTVVLEADSKLELGFWQLDHQELLATPTQRYNTLSQSI